MMILWPGDFVPLDVAHKEKATELYDLGRQAFDEGDFQRCADLLRASAALEPHFKTMEVLGEALLRLGNARESILWLAAAAGFSPKQVRSRLLLAEALEEIGEIGDARIQLAEALRVNPRYKSAAAMLARLPPPEEEEGLPT
jgi:tetratricopeptide (TPR) repeat protein